MKKKISIYIICMVAILVFLTGCNLSGRRAVEEDLLQNIDSDPTNISSEIKENISEGLTDVEKILESESSSLDNTDPVNDQTEAKEIIDVIVPAVRLSDYRILFGSYPKSRIKPTEELISAEYDSNGDAVVNGFKYRRVSKDDATYVSDRTSSDSSWHVWKDEYEYFIYEPIEWLIFKDENNENNDNNEYTLISEYSIDCQVYSTVKDELPVWETSDMRAWLNTTFYDISFSEDEKKVIKNTITYNVSDRNNGGHGDPTEDKVYLPLYSVVKSKHVPTHAFTTEYGDTMGTMCNRINIYAEDGKYFAHYTTRTLSTESSIWSVLSSDLNSNKYPSNVFGVRPMINISIPNVEFTTELVITENVEKLDVAQYTQANALTKVTLPESLTYISESAFEVCTNLKEINIPSNVQYISDGAFLKCENLSEVHIAYGLEKISSAAFSACKSLKKIDIPDSVIHIRSGAFYRSGLEELILPSGISAVYDSICQNAESLTRVVIPEGVKRIDHYAFKGCSSLTEVEILSSNASIDSEAFDVDNANLTIIAPSGSTAEKYAIENNINFIAK